MNPKRVQRPLGLTIAILSAALLFSGWPLVKAYLAWRLNEGINEAGLLWGNETFPLDWLTLGVAGLGLLTLITALFAWWGRPPIARFAFQGAVFLTALATIFEVIMRSRATSESLASGQVFLDSSAEFLSNVVQCQIPIQILVALYVIWYCNRAPARAFYMQTPQEVWRSDTQANPTESIKDEL